MWSKIFPVLCLLTLQVFAYAEILPTPTQELETRDESCQYYRSEVRHNNRRIGYLAFNDEGSASVTKDKHSAALLRTDSDGKPRAGKSFIGTKSSHKKYTTLKSLPKKKGALSDLGSGNYCYSKKTEKVYSGSVPERLHCNPITITPTCVKHQPRPNPSDGAYPKHAYRDDTASAKRSVRYNPAWEAVRAAL